MVVGAHARDRIVNQLARMEKSRLTRDVDIAIVSESMDQFRARTRKLGDGGKTGTAFAWDGVAVGILPTMVTGAGWTETTDGVLTDLTGMREAYDTADSSEWDGVPVRFPTLQAMVALKLVAWGARGAGTDKDAQDLSDLLEACSGGVFEDRCFEAHLLGRFDGDPAHVGAYLTGRDVARDLPHAATCCRRLLADPERHRLVSAMRRGSVNEGRLFALCDGMDSGLA